MSRILFIVWMCCCDWGFTVGRPSLFLSVRKRMNALSKTEASLNNFLWRINIGKCFSKKTISDFTLWSMLWWWNQMYVVCYGTEWVRSNMGQTDAPSFRFWESCWYTVHIKEGFQATVNQTFKRTSTFYWVAPVNDFINFQAGRGSPMRALTLTTEKSADAH